MSVGRVLIGLVVSLIVTSATNAQVGKATAQSSLLTVRADRTAGHISPYVYGANVGPWSMPGLAVMPEAMASGVTYLRFPAGDWGDLNEVTPLQVDTFLAFAHNLHAEPSISVRLKGGTPQVAAALVHYANVEKHYAVRYWSIGNEPNLYRNYSVQQFNQDWRKFAEAMLAVDPTITLVGPDISQYPPPQDSASGPFRDWLRSFLTANGDLVAVVSVHRYPFPTHVNAAPTTIDQLKGSASEWDAIIPDMRQVIKQTTGRDLPVAVTEVNSHWSHTMGGEATPDSFYNAVWWADVLGRLIRQRVNIVAYFALYTTGDSGSFGLLASYDVRPTYYVYQLYKRFGSTLVDSESTDPDITITAALRGDGALTLMIVNPAVQPKSVTLQVSGFDLSRQADLWRLDPDHKAERIGTTAGLASSTLDLPAQSVSLYIAPSGAF